MSQRSQVANSGSRPIEACSAAWAAPPRSTPAAVSASAWPAETVHHTARVSRWRGGRSSGVSPSDLAGVVTRRVKLTTWRVTWTSPKRTSAWPQRHRAGVRRGPRSRSRPWRWWCTRARTVRPGRPGRRCPASPPGSCRPDAGRPRPRGRSGAPRARRPCRPAGPVASSTTRTGARPAPRRPAAAAASRRIQYQPAARRRSRPAWVRSSTTVRAAGPKSSRSCSVSGSSAAAAHRCGASTYGLPGSRTVASTGCRSRISGWCTR